jgi:hypothetical protein
MKIRKVSTVYEMQVPKHQFAKFRDNAFCIYNTIKTHLENDSRVDVEFFTSADYFDGIISISIGADAKYSYRGAIKLIRKTIDNFLSTV